MPALSPSSESFVPAFADWKVARANNPMPTNNSFAPTDKKIATCSDDGSVRIFDFATKTEERELRGQ